MQKVKLELLTNHFRQFTIGYFFWDKITVYWSRSQCFSFSVSLRRWGRLEWTTAASDLLGCSWGAQ